MSAPDADLDPSVCYRHPDRTSWVLCTRCGKTICPECQILTPSGVQCPDCVRETGGSVRWEPTNRKPVRVKPKRAERAERATPTGWRGIVSQYFRPGGQTPVLSWTIAGIAIVVWIINLIAGNSLFVAFAVVRPFSWQIWRFPLSALVTLSAVDPITILYFLFSILIFVLIAPGIEYRLGRARLITLFVVGATVYGVVMSFIGPAAFGFTGPVWAMLGATLIMNWASPQARVQTIILVAFWLLISLVQSPLVFPGLVLALAAGVGTQLVFAVAAERTRWQAWVPWALVGGGTAVLVIAAIARDALL